MVKSKLPNRYVHSAAHYTHDGNKNVSEVVATDGPIAAHYEYAPFGALTAQRGESAAENPWRFSSEYAEDETGTVYYNYRHYEPGAGRWLQRDPIEEWVMVNYGFINNSCVYRFDVLGLIEKCPKGAKVRKDGQTCRYRTNQDAGGKKTVNGCGAEGGKKFPNGFLWMVDFTGCCNSHDECYGTCAKNKVTCDLKLGLCMRLKCTYLIFTPYLYGACISQANAYESAVLLAGGDAFDAAQDESCKWKDCCCD